MKMKYQRTFNARSIVYDLNRRRQLCQMIEVGRERRLLEMKMDGYNFGIDDKGSAARWWKTGVDPRAGHKFSFILRGGVRVFAIEYETGAIFAATSGGRANRELRYGTLDTLEQWNWALVEPSIRRTYEEES